MLSLSGPPVWPSHLPRGNAVTPHARSGSALVITMTANTNKPSTHRHNAEERFLGRPLPQLCFVKLMACGEQKPTIPLQLTLLISTEHRLSQAPSGLQ
ncbi:unnamed protein product [Lota lota]